MEIRQVGIGIGAMHRAAWRRAWAATLLLALFALAGAGCKTDPKAAARAYLASGARYLAHRKYREAAIQFHNALQKDPSDWKARYQLAQVENRLGEWRSSYNDLKSVVTAQPSFAPARLDLAELYVAAGQSRLAQEQLEQARRLDPKSVRMEIVEMKLDLGTSELDRATKQCAVLKQLAPADDEVYALCGLAETGQKQYPAAEQDFREALRIEPGSAENYRNLANLLDLEGKTDEAEALVSGGVKSHPDSLDLNLCLADLYVRHGRLAEADRLFASLVRAPKTFPNLPVALGNFWLWRNELPRAVAEFRAAEAAAPSELVEKNLASAYLTMRDVPRASRYTHAVLLRDPSDPDARALLGALEYLQGDYSQAGATLEAALKENPGSILANFYLGLTWLATGQTDRAKGAFGECVEANGKFLGAYVRLGQIALDSGDWRLGAEYARKVLAINPGAVDGYLLLAQADVMHGDLNGAGQIIDVGEKIENEPRAFREVAVRYDIARKNFPAADREFSQVMDGAPDPAPLVEWYASALASAGQVPRAIASVQESLASSPTNPALLELLARLYFNTGQYAKAEASVRQSLAESPIRSTAHELLGEILERRGENDRAASEYAAAIQNDPASVAGYLLAGNMAMREGRYEQAESYFDSGRLASPNSDAIKLALARCWAERGANLDQALALAQALKSRFPENPQVADTLGWIYHEKGIHPLAVEQLESAAHALPRDGLVEYHLGMELLATGRKRTARERLALALNLGLTASEKAAALKALPSMEDAQNH
ncbi:MAG: tetratricopeptide repeat protein [Acidobacteriota bacterium]|nr:tetratricopeptide repeat protein [Acidobacteriota bacterium]